ncbi:MAG: zinc ABC transporter substrate-binding protein [Bacteroidales bacterium]
MKFTRIFIFLAALSLLGMVFSCKVNDKKKRTVTVTILPQQYFAQKIAGDKFDVHVMVPAGSSPESFDPSPTSLVKVENSEAYFKIGHIGFELAWMDKLSRLAPDLKIYDNSQGIDLLHNEGHTCSHTDGHAHEHLGEEGVDPHTWTSPRNAAIIANNMLKAFIEMSPADSAYFRSNYNGLMEEINATTHTVDSLLTDLPARSFVIYHPSLTYLANDYHLNQFAIENEGKEPSAQYLKSMIDSVRATGAKVVFIQQEFDEKNAQVVASEVGAKVVSINPLSYNWSEEMIQIAKSLHEQ